MQFGIISIFCSKSFYPTSSFFNNEYRGEINQAIEIPTKLSLYCQNGKDIRASVQICSTLVFRDIIISQ